MLRNKISPITISAALIFLVLVFYIAPRLDRSLRDNDNTIASHIAQSDLATTESTDEFGALKYTQTRRGASPDLLWLTITYDHTSWGHTPDGTPRSITDLLQIVTSQHDVSKVSLGLLTSSPAEFEQYKKTATQLPFAQLTIIMHPGFQDGPTVDREHRHDNEVQQARRAEISKLRNYLMLKTLGQSESLAHIIWTDADVSHLDTNIVARMLTHVRDRPDVGILTARCSLGDMYNYDLNAWRGTREGPRGWDLDDKELAEGEMDLQGQYHVDHLIKGTGDDDLLALDTVGATLLYMRSSLIWRGLNFPHQYVVGTRWMKDGWDGIESEGLCYRARGLKGGKCMVLGGSWHVEHTTD